MKRYDLDTVMFPVYPKVWADPVYRADAEALLTYCASNDVGVQVIKAIARRPWGDRDTFARCWYEPQTEDDAIARGIGLALSTPGVTSFATVGDLTLLPRVLDAAAAYVPWSDGQREAVIGTMADDPVIFPIAEHFRRD